MGIYVESPEAIAIKQFWFALYGIAMVVTLIRYFRKHFVDNIVYRQHCRFWIFIMFLAALVHLEVAKMVKGYSCNISGLWLSCEPKNVSINVVFMIITSFGLANRQNAGNNGIEGLIVLMFIPAIFLLLRLQSQMSLPILKNFLPLQDEISLFIYMCLASILFALTLHGIAKLVGFQKTLIKSSKFFLFWLANAVYVLWLADLT